MESLLCSTCDNCTQCGDLEGEAERKLYSSESQQQQQQPESSQHSSQQILAEVHQEEEVNDLNAEVIAEVIAEDNVDKVADENQLRRQLKQAFGQFKPIQSSNSNDSNQTVKLKSSPLPTQQTNKSSIYPIYEPISDLVEHNVEYDVDFLSEYAQKTSLYHVEVSGVVANPLVLSKSGQTLSVTEDMFRGDIEGTLKKAVLDMDDNDNHHRRLFRNNRKTGTSPELNNNSDSGIASPPPDHEEFSIPTMKLTNKIDLIEEKAIVPNINEAEEGEYVLIDAGNDSGNDASEIGNGKSNKKASGPKRDTMIRELKTRLKEKFQQDGI